MQEVQREAFSLKVTSTSTNEGIELHLATLANSKLHSSLDFVNEHYQRHQLSLLILRAIQ